MTRQQLGTLGIFLQIFLLRHPRGAAAFHEQLFGAGLQVGQGRFRLFQIYTMCCRSCLLLLLAVAAARAQCPSGLTPANYTTPSGVPIAPCCYKGADGQPCCDGLGNPCRILEDSPDCCDGTAGGCYALFNRDGVDSVNFKVRAHLRSSPTAVASRNLAAEAREPLQVTGPSGDTEDKRCIWDGSSPTGHGRCFAPTLENWQGPLSQAALIDDGAPPLRDMVDQPVCLSNSVAVGQRSVKLSCDYPTEDGSPCYANQQMGTCKASECCLEAAAVAFAPASSVSPTQQQMGSPFAGKQAPISALPPDQQPIPPAYTCSGRYAMALTVYIPTSTKSSSGRFVVQD